MTDYAAEAARLQAANESLRAECDLLRAEAAQVGAINRKLQAQLAEAERGLRASARVHATLTWKDTARRIMARL